MPIVKKKGSGLIICSVSWSAHRNNPYLIYRYTENLISLSWDSVKLLSDPRSLLWPPRSDASSAPQWTGELLWDPTRRQPPLQQREGAASLMRARPPSPVRAVTSNSTIPHHCLDFLKSFCCCCCCCLWTKPLFFTHDLMFTKQHISNRLCTARKWKASHVRTR